MMIPNLTAAQAPAVSLPARILLVDDDDVVRRTVARGLGMYGFDVVCVSSGEEALQTIEREPHRFDLVISDVFMRGMSGVALAERIKLRDDETRVLLISGYPGSHFADSALTTED